MKPEELKNWHTGYAGENLFRSFCAQVGIIVTRPDSDQNGWDFLLELPQAERSRNIDASPPSSECRIQLKSTRSSKDSIAVSLSNLEKLSKSPSPCFLCLIHTDSNQSPCLIRIIHIDEKIISRTLKRIRQLEKEGKSDLLHKRNLTINFSNQTPIYKDHGQSILSYIQSCIGENIHDYHQRKSQSLETIGFEKGRYIANFSLSRELLRDFADMTLGLKDSIEVKDFQMLQRRFGIEIPDINMDSGLEGKISMPGLEPTIPAKITISKNHERPISIDGFAYPLLTTEIQRVRIVTAIFDFLFSMQDEKVSIKIEPQTSKPYTIEGLLKEAEFGLSLLSEGSKEIALIKNNAVIAQGTTSVSERSNVAGFESLLSMLTSARQASIYLGIPLTEETTIELIEEQANWLHEICKLIESPNAIEVHYDIDPSAKNEDNPDFFYIINGGQVRFHKKYFCFLYHIKGILKSLSENHLHVAGKSFEIEDCIAFPNEIEPEKALAEYHKSYGIIYMRLFKIDKSTILIDPETYSKIPKQYLEPEEFLKRSKTRHQ